MTIFSIIISILLSIFSTAVMSYISMATTIGPWIATTLVLMAMILFKLFYRNGETSKQLALVTFSGSVGGILAVAMAFSFPTLHFLDPELFNSWMARPWFFSTIMGSLAFVAGWFGIWVANIVEHKLIVEEELPFPIGQLVYKMIEAKNQVKKTWELAIGFVTTGVFCFLQGGVACFKGIIPKSILITSPMAISVFAIPKISFDLMPMLWAIGFVTGHVIAIPLAVGVLSKILVVTPLYTAFFHEEKFMEFLFAFCSGMVISGTVLGFLRTPKVLWKSVRKILGNSNEGESSWSLPTFSRRSIIEFSAMMFAEIAFLSYFGFPWYVQIYLLVFTFMCSYEVARQAGKIGLARLGAFATFVMVPGMIFFKLNFVQIMIIAAFVEISCGVAADILFGRKVGVLSSIDRNTMQRYQYLGLLVSALTIGVVFWVLIGHFGLGSEELFALKARNRSLLINAYSFNYYVLLLGFAYGFILKKIRINASLVLGGLLMPLNFSLGLIVGGIGALLSTNKEEWYPFWSGVFASNSIWMIIKALF